MIYLLMAALYLPYLPFLPAMALTKLLVFCAVFDPTMFSIFFVGVAGSIGVWRLGK